MIQSFASRDTEALYHRGVCIPRWRAFKSVALRKLDMVDGAEVISDLRSPPGNRLEALRGDRAGYWSIRINDQWRLCFRWSDSGPQDVVIVDYH